MAYARVTGIVLPEDHNGHHINPEIEFGDIFRFYDAPGPGVDRVAPRDLASAPPRRRPACDAHPQSPQRRRPAAP